MTMMINDFSYCVLSPHQVWIFNNKQTANLKRSETQLRAYQITTHLILFLYLG